MNKHHLFPSKQRERVHFQERYQLSVLQSFIYPHRSNDWKQDDFLINIPTCVLMPVKPLSTCVCVWCRWPGWLKDPSVRFFHTKQQPPCVSTASGTISLCEIALFGMNKTCTFAFDLAFFLCISLFYPTASSYASFCATPTKDWIRFTTPKHLLKLFPSILGKVGGR